MSMRFDRGEGGIMAIWLLLIQTLIRCAGRAGREKLAVSDARQGTRAFRLRWDFTTETSGQDG